MNPRSLGCGDSGRTANLGSAGADSTIDWFVRTGVSLLVKVGVSTFSTTCCNDLLAPRLLRALLIADPAAAPAPARAAPPKEPKTAFSAKSRLVGCPCIRVTAGPCMAPAAPSLNISLVTDCAVCGVIRPPAVSALATALSARCILGDAATTLSTALYGAAKGPEPIGAPVGTARDNADPKTSAICCAVLFLNSGRVPCNPPMSAPLPIRETNLPGSVSNNKPVKYFAVALTGSGALVISISRILLSYSVSGCSVPNVAFCFARFSIRLVLNCCAVRGLVSTLGVFGVAELIKFRGLAALYFVVNSLMDVVCLGTNPFSCRLFSKTESRLFDPEDNPFSLFRFSKISSAIAIHRPNTNCFHPRIEEPFPGFHTDP
ncbi:hypothetical protein D3C76_832430 [compost metagenome]